MRPVYPYPTLFGDVDVDVVGVSVDGLQLPLTHVSKVDRVVALHQSGRENWRVATLRLKARLPDAEVADGFVEVVPLAVLSEKATNVRVTERLIRDADGSWQGSIDVVRSRHAGRVSLSLIVAGTVEGVAARTIGATEDDWYVDLKAATPVRQQELKIIAVDFREGPIEWLRAFKDAPWIVDTADEDVPTVYVNAGGVEGMVDVLYGKGGGAVRALRETISSQIAQDAWTAMFHTAVGALDADEDETPTLPDGWRGSVLNTMLVDVLPGRSSTDALREIHDRHRRGEGWSELQGGIQYAAGRRSRVVKHLTNAIRSARSEGSAR
jgi:hypothetical protein